MQAASPPRLGRLKTRNPRAMFAALAVAQFLFTSAPTSTDIAVLSRIVDTIASAHPMDTARLGISVVEADNGKTIFARDEYKEFAPASNFKLLVGASALAYLGRDFAFDTRLLARGEVDGGVLQGDLILVGGGDPILSRADLEGAAA